MFVCALLFRALFAPRDQKRGPRMVGGKIFCHRNGTSSAEKPGGVSAGKITIACAPTPSPIHAGRHASSHCARRKVLAQKTTKKPTGESISVTSSRRHSHMPDIRIGRLEGSLVAIRRALLPFGAPFSTAILPTVCVDFHETKVPS